VETHSDQDGDPADAVGSSMEQVTEIRHMPESDGFIHGGMGRPRHQTSCHSQIAPDNLEHLENGRAQKIDLSRGSGVIPHALLYGSSTWVFFFAHILPLSIVKLADFVTDTLVIFHLYLTGNFLWRLGLSAVALSVISAVSIVVGVAGVLSCSSVRVLTAWQLAIALPLCVVQLAGPFVGWLAIFGKVDNVDMAKYQVFALLKLLGGWQSAALAIITAVSCVNAFADAAADQGRFISLCISSLSLSFLSIVYSFYGCCSSCTSYASKVRGGNALIVVLCVATNFFWFISVSALSIVTAPLYGYAGLGGLGLVSFLQQFRIYPSFPGMLQSLLVSIPFAIIDFIVVEDFRSLERPSYMRGPTIMDKRGFPVMRRIIMLAMGGVTMAHSKVLTLNMILAVVLGFIIDVLATGKLLSILEGVDRVQSGGPLLLHEKEDIDCKSKTDGWTGAQVGAMTQDEARPAGSVVVTTAPRPVIVYASAEWLSMVGLDAHEVAGRSLNVVTGPDTDGRKIAKVMEAVRQGKHEYTTVVLYTPLGDSALYAVHAYPRAPDEDPTGDPVCELRMQKCDSVALNTAMAEDGGCKLVVVAHAPFRIVGVTNEFERQFGFARDLALDRTQGLIHGPETDVTGWLSLFDSALAGDSAQLVVNAYSSDGAVCRRHMRVRPVLEGVSVGYLEMTFCVLAHTEARGRIRGENDLTFPSYETWMVQVRSRASRSGNLYLADMFIGVLLQEHSGQNNDGLEDLITFVKEILDTEGMFKDGATDMSALLQAVQVYNPWEEGSHRALLTKLQTIVLRCGSFSAVSDCKLITEDIPNHSFLHPMRGCPLAQCLRHEVWSDGAGSSRWDMSKDVDRCDYFCSHSWADEKTFPFVKLKILRSFLFLDYTIATLIVSSILVGGYLTSLGIGISSVAPSFPWYSPIAVGLCLVAVALCWIGISTVGMMSAQFVPWALSPTTLWMDIGCILQESPETIQAGLDSFPTFLRQCNGMIALVSPSYFTRLWCIYELAIFCRMHSDNLEERLHIMSLDWLSQKSSSPQLTPEEMGFFNNFSCSQLRSSKPADRAFLLNSIRHVWGSEEDFEQYVKQVLPDIMSQSKKKYLGQKKSVMLRVFDLSFGGA